MEELENFTRSLEDWYRTSGRDLPWRKNIDPYRVWISEIMLQQTQVSRVAESFYPNFLEKFPTLPSLASATWEEVYPFWKGLGYYSRGKNLLETAKRIARDHQGEIPQDKEVLKKLPGIGAYTANAIASFAWDEKVPAIDTNIRKIIQILWPKKDTIKLAHQLVRMAKSGRDWNNAMMDLATALRAGENISGELGKFFPANVITKFLPSSKKTTRAETSKTSGAKTKHRIEVGIACIHKDGKYLVQTRPTGKSFTGQWEFPGGKREKGEDFRSCVKREIKEELGIEVSVRPHFFEVEHEFEKTKLLLRFHRCQIQSGIPKPLEGQVLEWVSPEDFGKYEFLNTNARALEKLKKIRR